MSADDEPRGATVAAEIAIAEGELDRAEDALKEALSRVRYQMQEGDE